MRTNYDLLEKKYKYGDTTLYNALYEEQADFIAHLLAGEIDNDIKKQWFLKKNGYGYTALHLAIYKEVDSVITILNCNALKSLNYYIKTKWLLEKDFRGNTALNLAAYLGRYEAIVTILGSEALDSVTKKWFFLEKNNIGDMPLHTAGKESLI